MRSKELSFWRYNTPAAVLVAGLALSSCVQNNRTSADDEPLTIGAVTERSVAVFTENSTAITLSAGSRITALCVSGHPFNIKARIESRSLQNIVVVNIPRDSLQAVSTPSSFGQNDPFGALEFCDNE